MGCGKILREMVDAVSHFVSAERIWGETNEARTHFMPATSLQGGNGPVFNWVLILRQFTIIISTNQVKLQD